MISQVRKYIATGANHVQVELHSRLKKVMVTHDRVAVAGDRFGATDSSSKSDANANMMTAGVITPFLGGGSTPMHGGATPMYTGGGVTPNVTSSGAKGRQLPNQQVIGTERLIVQQLKSLLGIL